MNGQYFMQLLNPLMKKNNQGLFAVDETNSKWHKQTNVEILQNFCREGYPMAKKYGHFIIGNSESKSYIGIPGRFILEEQPAGGASGFTLWQPIRGGEEMYKSLDEIDEQTAQLVYGYWIACIDNQTLKITEV